MRIMTIGLDLAKSVFAVHGIDEKGQIVVKRNLRRLQVLAFFGKLEPCLVGMEASAGAHYWARELSRLGHTARLMPPGYVKAYVKRGKTDAADAAAICEAVCRPTMRFVPVKTVDQQGLLALHRARDVLVRQRTQLANVVRSICSEFGVVAAKGQLAMKTLADIVADDRDTKLDEVARAALKPLLKQLSELHGNIGHLEQELMQHHKGNEASRRLATVPGIGPLTATALIASIGDTTRFRSGRDLSAWLGLTPQPRSSGGKHRVGRTSKQGNSYLRRLFVQGAQSLLYAARRKPAAGWAQQLLERKPQKVVAVAVANKNARIAWSVLAHGGVYRPASLAKAV
jgi:transposase